MCLFLVSKYVPRHAVLMLVVRNKHMVDTHISSTKALGSAKQHMKCEVPHSDGSHDVPRLNVSTA